MGDFKITIHAQGGHGCERKAQPGEVFFGCGSLSCPDCFWTMALQQWVSIVGGGISDATFTHWPASMNTTHGRQYREAEEVVDDLNYHTAEGYRSPRMRKRIKGKFGV
jgi:hypothetical protein